MDFIDVLKNTPLSTGAHKSGSGKACVMEKVSILWALSTGQDVSEVFSDLPPCTNHVVARVAQTVNDTVSDDERQRLNLLIPRLLRARQTPSDKRINVRLAIWAARRVLHLITDDERRAVALRAIESAEAWLADPTAANAAAATAAAATAAATAAAAAAAAYATATAAAATEEPIEFLDALLDAWEEAAVKEGEDIYVPQAWEDEALQYMAEMGL